MRQSVSSDAWRFISPPKTVRVTRTKVRLLDFCAVRLAPSIHAGLTRHIILGLYGMMEPASCDYMAGGRSRYYMCA